MEMVLLVATGLISASAFVALALSQTHHWTLVLEARPKPPQWLRWVGAVLLALALVSAIWRDGVAFGLLLWVAMLTPSAFPVVGYLAWKSRQPRV